METGDGYNEDSGGLPPNEENVIRLPRDWLGPPEELVPIGPAARARAAQRELDDGMPPAADAFWSEDSAALHDAVQAPSASARTSLTSTLRERLAPPVGLVPPVAGVRPPRRIHLPSLRALRGVRRLSWRPTLLAAGVAALAAIAVIGTSEGPVSHQVANHPPVPRSSPSASDLTASANAAAGEKAAAARNARVVTRRHSDSHDRTRTHGRRTPVVKPHHRSAVHHSEGPPARTVTEAATSHAPVDSSASSATTTPTTATASTVASTGSKPATGPAGPTGGLGEMTGGCLPKCK